MFALRDDIHCPQIKDEIELNSNNHNLRNGQILRLKDSTLQLNPTCTTDKVL